jgi:hypothetical protein
MSLKANDRIVLIRVKIERAKKHLRDLETMLISFRDESSTIITGEVHLGFHIGAPREDFQVGIAILPFDAIAAAGDVVHNLRSALDHLAHQLVVVGGELLIAIPCSRLRRTSMLTNPVRLEK